MGEDIEFTKDSQDHPSENNQTAVAFTHRAKPTMTYQNSNTNFDHANKPHAKNTKHSNGDVSCPAEPSHSKAMQESTMTRKNYFPQNTLTKVLTNVPTSLNPDKHTTVTFTPATNQFISQDENDGSEDGDYISESGEEGTDSSNSIISLVDEDEMDLEAEM
ncbi:hypothetical protein WN944_006314 [Citrus x changshan-huyou]|uniref:Uncharacterized protein n=1 Tax=Citrus x changshan-huyou TaxID=2935761 RepID=A0AAP0MP33_9ROSI